jgi:hypothetical protein
MGLINEDNSEDYEGTFKAYNNNNAYRMSIDSSSNNNNARRYDSLLDGTDLALD